MATNNPTVGNLDLLRVGGEITIGTSDLYKHCHLCGELSVSIHYDLTSPDNIPSDIIGGVCEEHKSLGVTATLATHAALLNGKHLFELKAENKRAVQDAKLEMVHELLTALGRDGAYSDPPMKVWQGALDEVARLKALHRILD